MPTHQPQAHDHDVFYITDVFQAIWRRRGVVMITSVISLFLGLVIALSLSDRYKSYAMIRVETPVSISTGLNTLPLFGGESAGAIETEIAVLKSRAILGEVIETLNLRVFAQPDPAPFYKRLPFFGKYFRDPEAPPATIAVEDLSVPDKWQDKEIWLEYNGENKFSIGLPDGTELEGQVGETLVDDAKQFALTVSSLSAPEGQDFTLRRDRLFSTLDWLEKSLEVAQDRQTEMVTLSMRDFAPDRAQQILATTLNVYSNYNQNYAVELAQRRLDHVESELPISMKSIDDAEEKLNTFQKETQTINVQVQTEYLLKRLAENEELLRDDQRPTERQRLEEIRDEILSNLREVPDTQQQMQNLQRDIEIAQEIYIGLMKVVQEQRIQRASAFGTIRILDPSLANEQPVGRGRSIIVLGVWLLGTLMAVFFVVARANREDDDVVAGPKETSGPAS